MLCIAASNVTSNLNSLLVGVLVDVFASSLTVDMNPFQSPVIVEV